MKQRIETKVENGTILKTISFGNGSVGISATPEHRFYACFEDSITKDTKCDWVAAQKLNPKTMKLYGANHQLVPFAEVTDITLEGKYTAGDINFPGSFYPAKVYNLSTETFSYYVTDSINRVLVHNMY